MAPPEPPDDGDVNATLPRALAEKTNNRLDWMLNTMTFPEDYYLAELARVARVQGKEQQAFAKSVVQGVVRPTRMSVSVPPFCCSTGVYSALRSCAPLLRAHGCAVGLCNVTNVTNRHVVQSQLHPNTGPLVTR